MDGNFAAEHQKMKNPEDDVWLSDGDAFFVGRHRYGEHLQTAVEIFEVCATYHCENMYAYMDNSDQHAMIIRPSMLPGTATLLMLPELGLQHVRAMGALCHIPWSIFPKAKSKLFPPVYPPTLIVIRQAYMDYSYASSVEQVVHPDVGEVLLFYDVICQWSIKLALRVERSSILQALLSHVPNLRLVKGIGLFHVHGHKQSCLPRFSPDFIHGAGSVDGEVIETLWAIMNDTTRATRGMTSAHRQEVIDDNMAYSNWVKLVRMGAYWSLYSN